MRAHQVVHIGSRIRVRLQQEIVVLVALRQPPLQCWELMSVRIVQR